MSSLQQVRNSARLLRALVRARTVAVALVVVLASSGRAQDRRPENPSDPSAPFIERIEFGWDGIVTDGRWTPITVWLGGGAKGFSGLLNETRSKTEKYQALNCLTGHGATARNFNTWECRWMYPPAAQKPEGGE